MLGIKTRPPGRIASAFNNQFLNHVYVCGYAHMYVGVCTRVQCPQRPEASEFPGAGVSVVIYLKQMLGTELGSSEREYRFWALSRLSCPKFYSYCPKFSDHLLRQVEIKRNLLTNLVEIFIFWFLPSVNHYTSDITNDQTPSWGSESQMCPSSPSFLSSRIGLLDHHSLSRAIIIAYNCIYPTEICPFTTEYKY